MTAFEELDRVVDRRLDGWVAELVDYCRIGSEAGDLPALRAAAEWTAERFRRSGAEVDVVELPGQPDVPPLVVGTIGSGPRTINLVQHYDVQPAVPLELWTSAPYEPEVRDGRVFGRGATDNKGEFLPRLWAVESWREALGELPVRIRFLVEGEEESGSQHLDALLDQRPDLRRADAALIEGGGLSLEGRPEVAAGGRGIILAELSVRTIEYDAHSSLATLLPNAAVRLSQALASMWQADGLPAVAGLSVGVRPPTPSQLAVVEATSLEIIEDVRSEFRPRAFVGGREGREAIRAEVFSPTLNIQGLWSGFTGPGAKTITPAQAHARVDIRLVPDQVPETVIEAVRDHLAAAGFDDVEVRLLEAERAWWTPPDHPVVDLAIEASEAVAGQSAIRLVSMPGTVPMYQVCAAHRVPATTLGAARDDCRAHAPDENVRIDDLAMATRITARFLDGFASLGDVPPVA
ncbi:MAG: M20/M25/M40 family metallo-hydrolase [Chloroflexota bacterium]